MSVHHLLAKKKAAIVDRWFHVVVETYPSETARFLKREKDPFANPVGSTISKGLEGLFEELIGENDRVRISSFLDQVIRIRAIQEFSPSEALGFVVSVKKVIREALADDLRAGRLSGDELLQFESRIDEMLLLSFDVFMSCREQVYQIRAHEIRNRTSKLLERANLAGGTPDQGADPDGDNHDGST
jgi:hypothetical protein